MLIFKEMRRENLIKLSLNYIKIKIIKMPDFGEAAEGLRRNCGRTESGLNKEEGRR